MATVKSFSVARTQKSYDPTSATPASGVYSYGAVPATTAGTSFSGRNGAYDHATEQGGLEGRVPTLVLSGQTTAQQNPANTGVPSAVSLATLGSGSSDWAADTYICTTTNINGNGAGLILRVDVAANGTVTLNSSPIVEAGAGYLSDDSETVTIDGIGGTVTVTAGAEGGT